MEEKGSVWRRREVYGVGKCMEEKGSIWRREEVYGGVGQCVEEEECVEK
jgi:hypothetical protein